MFIPQQIVGITGVAGSGKTTAGDILVKEHGFARRGFADPIKDIARNHFAWDGVKDERGRRLLQVLGTEAGTDYEAGLWIKQFQEWVHTERPQKLVVDDVRRLSEVRAIEEYGGMVFLMTGRGGLDGEAAAHRTERSDAMSALSLWNLDNSGSIQDLKNRVALTIGLLRGDDVRKPHPLRVYISGPMSLGDRIDNLADGMKAMRELIAIGYAPILPHLTFFCEPFMEISHPEWVDIDLPWVRCAEAVLRLPGESIGADREVDAAIAAGVPVFYSVPELVAHFSSIRIAVFEEQANLEVMRETAT